MAKNVAVNELELLRERVEALERDVRRLALRLEPATNYVPGLHLVKAIAAGAQPSTAPERFFTCERNGA